MSDLGSLSTLRNWSARRAAVAAGATLASVLVVGVPTDLIDTPFFSREIPPTWWSWPALIISSLLAGLLVATYVREDVLAETELMGSREAPVQAVGLPGLNRVRRVGGDSSPGTVATTTSERATTRSGTIGGILTFFAVGCPVCNKLVLVALGSAGAITWFEPVQPLLQLVAIGLLVWALSKRLEGERSCRVTAPSVSTHA